MRVWNPARVARRTARPAFTLVELMVVVVIIGILIGILIPAVGAVRKQAMNASTKAALATLSTTLEMFKADGQIGGGYPPSFSDSDGTGGFQAPPQGEVSNPYADLPGQTSTGTSIDITGAGLLVWALAGADQLGTPGFKGFRTGNQQWSADTDAGNIGDDPTSSGAYALRSDGRALHARYGPYVDTDKVRLSAWDRVSGRFEIPAEKGNIDDNVRRAFPMFLDGFGFPILYWKADSAGVQMADSSRFDGFTGTGRGIYHWEDDRMLVDPDSPDRLVLRPGANAHTLDFPTNSNTSGMLPDDFDYSDDGLSFARYIMDTSINAKLAPHKADSYLLVTPGADGVYGTGDDVANFGHNGR